MPTHPLVAGIDLGTTNSAIAVVVDGELKVLPVHGELTMPSAVGLDPAGRLVIGRAAKNQEISAPENTILSIKRHMGTDHVSTLGGKGYSPEEISALILGELKREAEKHLGQPVSQAVITVPAFFNEQQRKATQAAGQLAGLEVLRIINEPTAAALAYGAGTGGSTGPQTMLVYDLGGGTFDVSLVEVDQGIVEVKASHGDTHLGGDDFDILLANLAAERFSAQEGAGPLPDAARRRLKGVMERVKIQLSEDPFVTVNEEYLDASRHLVTEVARADYEELITPLLEKTLDCMQRALHDGGVTAREVDRIMLVGGATRTPLVHQLIAGRMGREPRHEINPDLIVAMGAAIQGAALGGQPAPAILIDITAHTYRAEVLVDDMLVCLPLIPRGTPLPVRRAESYYTPTDNQESVRINVFQGESLYADGNTLLGEISVTGLSRKPAGNPVVVQFQLDLNGLLNVTATEKLTGLAKTITIDTRGQHRLNLDAARANLDALFADQRDEVEEFDVSDAEEDSDEYEDHEGDIADEADAGEPAGNEAGAVPSADADTPAPAGLVASARSLRQRAEALLTKGVSDKDSADISRLLAEATTALKSRQWSALRRHADCLSDIIFYLED